MLTPRLKPHAHLAIVSPASAAKVDLVEQGAAALAAFGYSTTILRHALDHGPLYYAGTAEQRAADLQLALTGEGIDGVICTRGGWGSAELLPLLNMEACRANPRSFLGYSDHTSLHVHLWNTSRMRSYYAPMVAADWATPDGVHLPTWNSALMGEGAWRVGAADGLSVLREGRVEGRLLGGCLSILEAGLGTPWALRIMEPTILFLEDIGTKPYQWDRMLQHLRFAGLMTNVKAVVLGDMSASVEDSQVPLVQAACLHALSGFAGPVVMGLKCGHMTSQNRSLPLGAWATLEGAELWES